MIDDDLCLSLIRGLSTLDFRDTGLDDVVYCSDSEELELEEELLEAVGDKLGLVVRSYMLSMGSGNAAVASPDVDELDIILSDLRGLKAQSRFPGVVRLR